MQLTTHLLTLARALSASRRVTIVTMKSPVKWKPRDKAESMKGEGIGSRRRSCSRLKSRLFGCEETPAVSPTGSSPDYIPQSQALTEGSIRQRSVEVSPSMNEKHSTNSRVLPASSGRLRSLFRRLSIRGRKNRPSEEAKTRTTQSATTPSSTTQFPGGQFPPPRRLPYPVIPEKEEGNLEVETTECSVSEYQDISPLSHLGDGVQATHISRDQESPIESGAETNTEASMIETEDGTPRIALVGVFLNGLAVALASFAPGGGDGARELVRETLLFTNELILPGNRYTSRGSSLAVHLLVDPRNRVYSCVTARDVSPCVVFNLLHEIQVQYYAKVKDMPFSAREHCQQRRCKELLAKGWAKYEKVERNFEKECLSLRKLGYEVSTIKTSMSNGVGIETIALEFNENGPAVIASEEVRSKQAISVVLHKIFPEKALEEKKRREKQGVRRYARVFVRMCVTVFGIVIILRRAAVYFRSG